MESNSPNPTDGDPAASILPHLARAQQLILERDGSLGDNLLACAAFLRALQETLGEADALIGLRDVAELAGPFFAREPGRGTSPRRPWEAFYAWCVEQGHLTQAEADRALDERPPAGTTEQRGRRGVDPVA
jgi:hypothetical protein